MKRFALAVSLVLLLVLTSVRAEAQCCYYNPLVLPFAVAGAVVGTAAGIMTAMVPPPPVYRAYPGPYYAQPRVYYGPGPYPMRRAWIPGYYPRYGYGGGGHWR
jgi:hypothetical protein